MVAVSAVPPDLQTATLDETVASAMPRPTLKLIVVLPHSRVAARFPRSGLSTVPNSAPAVRNVVVLVLLCVYLGVP